jgi:glycosyltransferase involved in cell wall biosynthesis
VENLGAEEAPFLTSVFAIFMNIGVDVRVLMDKEYSGVSWYALDLLSAILEIDEKNKYFFYYNSFHDINDRLTKFNLDNVRFSHTRFPNKIFNYFLQKVFSWPKLDVVAGGQHGALGKIDVFWSPHINFSSFSKNCKKMLTVHDLSFLIYPEFFSARKNFWHRFLGLKKLIKESDIVVAISESTKRDIIKFFNVQESGIIVVYPGIDERFKKMDKENILAVKNKYNLPDNFIFSIGNLEPRKNIAGLIRAFDSASDSLGDYSLVIAGGKGWKNKEILSAFGKAKNKDKIKNLGYVDDVDRPALYNLAKMFVYPSFYEGFGLPILESMACGCPVITGDASSLPEAAGDAALLVDVSNEKAIERAIISLGSNENLQSCFSEKGLEQAMKFRWKKAAEEYVRILCGM